MNQSASNERLPRAWITAVCVGLVELAVPSVLPCVPLAAQPIDELEARLEEVAVGRIADAVQQSRAPQCPPRAAPPSGMPRTCRCEKRRATL